MVRETWDIVARWMDEMRAHAASKEGSGSMVEEVFYGGGKEAFPSCQICGPP